jgi:hypothetical protein
MRPVLLLFLAACNDLSEPVYLRPEPPAIESTNVNSTDEPTVAVLRLPIRLESENQRIARQSLADALGLTLEQVPQARRDAYDVSLEWTVKNLDTEREGVAFISVVGANEFFRYDPLVFVEDPDEEDPPPPLLGGAPVVVPPGGLVSGLFRDDQVGEAAQDLDAISRAGVVPQVALLTRWPGGDVPLGAGEGGELMTIPAAAVPALVEMDVSVIATTRMVLEFVVRVRYREDRLEPPPNDPGGLVVPSETVFVPAAPAEEP